jgi:Tol biopolymer transport system component
VFLAYRLQHEKVQLPKQNLVLRQLSASSADNFVEYALISPDGKYLVYLEKGGALFLTSIETGETRVLVAASGDVYPHSWFPGGAQLLVTKWGEDGLWKLSVLTGKMTKLANKGERPFVSPDGKRILYLDSNGREVWVMGSEGQEPRRVMTLESSDSVWSIAWSPDSHLFAYVISRLQPSGKRDILLESESADGGQRTSEIFSASDTVANYGAPLLWLSDERVVFARKEPPPNERDSNFWSVGVDPVTGARRGIPERLTNWVGFETTYASATSNGKQLVFMKSHSRRSMYVATIAPNQKSHFDKVDRLMTDTWGEQVDTWATDGDAVYISAKKGAKFGVYRQDIRQQVSEPVITGPDDYYDVQLSPDGGRLLYTASNNPDVPELNRLFSVPIEGGSPTLLARGDFKYQCALPPSRLCVASKQDKAKCDFYWLDPIVGLAGEPFKTTGKVINWSLSPDGKKLALVELEDASRVQIASLAKGTSGHVEVGKWTQSESRIQYLSWFPNSQGLYLTAFLPSGTSLLSLTFDGFVTVAFEQGRNWLCCPTVTRDGRRLAFSVSEAQRDIVMIENF